jgi:tetratricopeptide (TPR) repeat protein
MMNGLNFNRSVFMLFLPFVSFLVVEGVYAQTSAEEKDEFALFESTPESAPAPKKEKPRESAPLFAPTPASSQDTDANIDRLKNEIRNDPQNVYLIVELAENFIEKGDYEKGTLLLWKQVDKLDRDQLLVLARAHEKRNEPGEMIRALNIILSKKEKDVEALTLLGRAYLLQKKNKDAMETYKKAVEINPKYEPAYRGLVDLYEKRTPPNIYELRILFQDMLENIGPRYQYYVKLCELNTMDNTHEPAIKDCKAAIAKNSKEADPYVYLGISYRAIGEEKKGLKTLKKAADDFPESELAQFTYAKTLEEKKDFVEAMNFFKAATDANGKSARSWLGLAAAAFEIRKYEVAIIAYKNACKYDKKNAATFRKAAATLRNARNSEWTEKYATASEHCTY